MENLDLYCHFTSSFLASKLSHSQFSNFSLGFINTIKFFIYLYANCSELLYIFKINLSKEKWILFTHYKKFKDEKVFKKVNVTNKFSYIIP